MKHMITHTARGGVESWYWRGDGWSRLRGEAKLYTARSASAARKAMCRVYYADEIAVACASA